MRRLIKLVEKDYIISEKINEYINNQTPYYLRHIILFNLFENPKIKGKIYTIVDIARINKNESYLEELIELLKLMREY